jgi:hypothetical protein
MDSEELPPKLVAELDNAWLVALKLIFAWYTSDRSAGVLPDAKSKNALIPLSVVAAAPTPIARSF